VRRKPGSLLNPLTASLVRLQADQSTPTDRAGGIRSVGLKLWKNSFPLFIVMAVIVLDLLALRGSLISDVFQRSDLNPPIWGWDQLSNATISAWNFQGSGPGGYANWILWQGFVATITGVPGVVELAFYIIPFPVAFGGCYLFIRRWGLNPNHAIAFAALFQFSPWFVGQFVTGEPVFVWVFAILPWYLWTMLAVVTDPGKPNRWVPAALALSIAGGFSLQSLPIFVLLTIPFLAAYFGGGLSKSLLQFLAGTVLVFAAAGVVNLASVNAYFAGLSSLSAFASQGPWTNALVGPAPSSYYLAILSMVAISCVLLLVSPNSSRDWHRGLVLVIVLETVLIEGLFFAIPNSIVRFSIFDTGLLAPFIDLDKFVLIAWLCAFLSTAELVRVGLTSQRRMGLRQAITRVWQPKTVREAHFRSTTWRRTVQIAAVSTCVVLLVATSMFVSIQGPYDDVSGVAFVSAERPLVGNEVPNTYLELRQFLLQNGASFGLGFKTAVVPQNPGSYTPYSIGPEVIPGFVAPSLLLQNVTSAFITNESQYAQLLALQGVKYLALVSPPVGLVWPALAAAGPSEAEIYPGEWIPLGNFSAYHDIIDSWPTFVLSYRGPGLLVFRNLDYLTEATSFGSLGVESSILNGSFTATTNLTPIGPNLIANGSSPELAPWASGPQGSLELFPNGTIGISSSATEPYIYQTFHLRGNQSYQLNLSISSSSGLGDQRLAGTSTYAAVYWDQADSNYASPTGGEIFPAMVGDLNGTYSYVFVTPRLSGPLSAAFFLYFQTPRDSGTFLYVRLGGIQLLPIDGSSTFAKTFVGVALSSTIEDRISLSFIPLESPSFVAVSMAFVSGWRIEAPVSQATVRLFDGPSGMLTLEVINATNHTVTIGLAYSPQAVFELTTAVGIIVLVALVILVAVPWLVRSISRFPKHADVP
jgi:hypothetical protein